MGISRMAREARAWTAVPEKYTGLLGDCAVVECFRAAKQAVESRWAAPGGDLRRGGRNRHPSGARTTRLAVGTELAMVARARLNHRAQRSRMALSAVATVSDEPIKTGS